MREAGKSTAHIAVADDTSTTILTPHAAAIIDRLAGNDALAILGAICAAYEAGLHDGKAVEPWRAREMALDARDDRIRRYAAERFPGLKGRALARAVEQEMLRGRLGIKALSDTQLRRIFSGSRGS